MVRLEFTSESEHLAEVRLAVEEMARQAGLGNLDVKNVALALDEAITNVIRHGYGGEAGRPIRLEIENKEVSGRKTIEFNLLDLARQVEQHEIVGRDLENVRPGGLGTHIIRSMMNEVEYSKRPEGGMRLRMVKYVG